MSIIMGWDEEFPEPFLQEVPTRFIEVVRVSINDWGGTVSYQLNLIDVMHNPQDILGVDVFELVG